MPLTIVRQDITKMNVDAIVNAANTALQRGGGVCGAIFAAAGAEKLQAACDKLAPIRTGEAVITPGFALPANYIIHTAGPVYNPSHKEQSRKLLRSAYLESLKLAEKAGCESIAFPLISSGIYGYPKKEALEVARLAIGEFLVGHEMQVYLVLFDKEAFALSEILFGEREKVQRRKSPQSLPLPSRRNSSGYPLQCAWDTLYLSQNREACGCKCSKEERKEFIWKISHFMRRHVSYSERTGKRRREAM